MRIRAITFDLDDTLWPIAPVMLRAEQRLDAWLRAHCPRAAAAYPVEAMRALRDRIADENPHIAHDFSAQRRLSLRAALLAHGYGDDHVDAAFTAFYAERNRIEYYADALPALDRLRALYPLAAITNGNADLDAIGLAPYFHFSLRAGAFGTAKPAAEIFHAACARLGLAPDEVLHVGDDPELDVIGAHRAGLRSVWLHRGNATWTEASAQSEVRPDLTVRDLGELVDALGDAPEADARASPR
ncbi:MAG: HAD-IA family hydrolase [Proteobacteria bacterium]|uniref:HAD family hydrolase n=1 Tax=Rudaea sp. TaxID=2136325 RepID=UPI0032202D5C|nr:HAD-IA family hydrolase [Pseudomonadota bacterium]